MAFIRCPECGRKISDRASACPECGYPVKKEWDVIDVDPISVENAEAEAEQKYGSDPSKISFTDTQLEKALNQYKNRAKDYLQDPDKFDHLMERMETKMNKLPGIGKFMGDLTCMIALIKSYMMGEYREVPIGTIVGMVAAVAYVVSPLDLIPDVLPGIGLADDAAVIMFAMKMMQTDIDEFRAWRKRR